MQSSEDAVKVEMLGHSLMSISSKKVWLEIEHSWHAVNVARYSALLQALCEQRAVGHPRQGFA